MMKVSPGAGVIPGVMAGAGGGGGGLSIFAVPPQSHPAHVMHLQQPLAMHQQAASANPLQPVSVMPPAAPNSMQQRQQQPPPNSSPVVSTDPMQNGTPQTRLFSSPRFSFLEKKSRGERIFYCFVYCPR